MEEERICTHCGEVISRGEGTTVSGDLMCDECVEEICITCEWCYTKKVDSKKRKMV